MQERKNIGYVRENYPAVILYLDDLMYIEKLLVDNHIDFTINTDTFEKVKSISELTDETDNFISVKDLSFESYDPRIEISFSDYATTFVYYSNSILIIGLVSHLKKYLSNKTFFLGHFIKSKNYSIEGLLIGSFIGIFLNLAISFLIDFVAELNIPYTVKVVTNIIQSIILVTISYKLFKHFFLYCNNCKIYLYKQPPKRNFWQRHEDKIVDKSITFILGVLTTLLGFWLKSYFQ